MANPPLQSPTYPHFFQPLLPGFDTHLTIPVVFFSKNIEGNNEQKTAKLRSDASDTTWEVKMEDRKLTGGWKDFATAHNLRIGDILSFKQEGDMVFHVTPFGPSCCEIQYTQSHIIKEEDDSNDEDNNENENQHKIRNVLRKENPKPQTETESSTLSYDYCFVREVTASNLQLDVLYIPKEAASSKVLNKRFKEIIVVNKEGESWTLDLNYREPAGSYFIRGGWRSFCLENRQKAGDLIPFNLVGDGKSTPLLCIIPEEECVDLLNEHKSKERVEKKKEKRRYWVASSSSRQNRFVTIILTEYNIRNSKIVLPINFVKINGIHSHKKIILKDKYGVKRIARLINDGRRRRGLGKGWKAFCEANDVYKVGEPFKLELFWEDAIPGLRFFSKVKLEPICV